MIGVSIKPNFLNLIIIVVEFAIKIILKIVLYILLIIIEVIQIALEIAMIIVEGAQKAVNWAQRSLRSVERMIAKRADAKRSEEKRYVDMELTIANKLEPLTQRGEDFCEGKFESTGRRGCYRIDGRYTCAFSMVRSAGSLPDNCEQFMAGAYTRTLLSST
jgi:hypothetical protein